MLEASQAIGTAASADASATFVDASGFPDPPFVLPPHPTNSAMVRQRIQAQNSSPRISSS
jgi:hypothetical protein